ncbi:Single-stranded DNA-binding protein [Fusarium oxysporum f. sp. albedinis]|nr:Single-stranded DNA-binding protein [Fusarium oxysporum f. sp. albedinis]
MSVGRREKMRLEMPRFAGTAKHTSAQRTSKAEQKHRPTARHTQWVVPRPRPGISGNLPLLTLVQASHLWQRQTKAVVVFGASGAGFWNVFSTTYATAILLLIPEWNWQLEGSPTAENTCYRSRGVLSPMQPSQRRQRRRRQSFPAVTWAFVEI